MSNVPPAEPQPNVIRCFNVEPVDVRPLVNAADNFLRQNARYERFLADPGSESGDSVFRLASEAFWACQTLQEAVQAAGLMAVSPITGSKHKVDGLAWLCRGVRRLVAEFESSPYARRCYSPNLRIDLYVPEGETFHYLPSAVAEIEMAVQFLREAMPRTTPDGHVPTRPNVYFYPEPILFPLPASGAAEPAGTAPAPLPGAFVPIAEDLAILAALERAGMAIIYTAIVQEAAQMRRDARTPNKPVPAAVSRAVAENRIPLLLKAGLVQQPRGRDGRPMRRKGVAITEAGRALLQKVGWISRS